MGAGKVALGALLVLGIAFVLPATAGAATAGGGIGGAALRPAAGTVPSRRSDGDAPVPDSVVAWSSAGSGGSSVPSGASPVVGLAPSAGGGGYWAVSSDGGVFSYGDAPFHGSLPGLGVTPAAPVVGIAADPATGGYWLASADGGVYAFDAPFHGSLPSLGVTPAAPVVGIAADPGTPAGPGTAADPSAGGYWLAGADGGVYAFDAPFHGSLPGLGVTPAAPVVGIAADPGTAAGSTAGGYWLAGVDGGVYAFDAPFHGSDEASAGPAWRNPPAGTPVVAPCVAISSFAWGYLVAFGAETSPLGQAVTSYLASRAGNVTAAVYDELTGQTFVVNPSSAQDTASIVKVDILATALREAQSQGRFLTPGEESLAVPMIEVSDNAAATALWGDVGGAGGVSAFDRLVGMPGTTPNAAGYWGLTTTTAVDQVALLRDLAYSGAVLPAASRSYELSLMEHVTSSQAWGVSAGVAPGSTVALKNGWLPLAAGDWQVNSIGVVSGSGRSYAIAVLTTGDPSLGYGIQSISQVSQLVWGALGG